MPIRELRSLRIATRLKADALQRAYRSSRELPRIERLPAGCPLHAALHRERDVVEGGQFPEHAGDLERIGDPAPDPLVRGKPGDVVAVEDDTCRRSA